MIGRSGLPIPIFLLAVLFVAVLPMQVNADVITSFTIHETPTGAVTSTVAGCSFYVKAVGLGLETGVVRIYQPQGVDLPIEVASTPWQGTRNADGTVDATAGPITVAAGLGSLFAVADHGDPLYWNLVSEPFQVACPAQTTLACTTTGFLPPLDTPGHDRGGPGQVFKFGQNVPVKTKLTCPGGEPYMAPRIYIAKHMGASLAAEQPAASTSSAFTMNYLDQNGNHWHYNLDTSKMSKGLWRLRVDVGDGADHLAWLDLR